MTMIINVMMTIYAVMGNCVDVVLNLMDVYPVQCFMAVLIIGAAVGVSLKNWILVVE